MTAKRAMLEVYACAEDIMAATGIDRPAFEKALDETLRAPLATTLRDWDRNDPHHHIAVLLMAVADNDPEPF